MVGDSHERSTWSAGPAARIVFRPIATPFPVGFSALATASLLAAGLELGWFSAGDRRVVALVLIGFAFPLQILASIFGFLGRDTAAATGFGVQGATWLVVGLNLLLSRPGSTSHALGVLLLASAVWVTLGAAGAAMGKLVPAGVLLLTAIRFMITGLFELIGSRGIEHAAGVIGLVLVVFAAYAVLATEVESLQRRTILPLLRRGAGKDAMTANLAVQSRQVEHEAGVREQL